MAVLVGYVASAGSLAFIFGGCAAAAFGPEAAPYGAVAGAGTSLVIWRWVWGRWLP